MSSPPIIVWFRRDLRLTDNPALSGAADTGRPILPVYILEAATDGRRSMGGASRWWLDKSLQALGDSIDGLNGHLILRSGEPEQVLTELITETG
ncbi:MAG: deoxyribodipyrimidine photo-lyase, partial [Planctomycetota bacterium]